VTDRACCCAPAVPSSDPREPVLFLRCGGLADAEALAANVDGSWSPKIAAVLKTSLGGAPPATGLSPLLLFTHAATAWMYKNLLLCKQSTPSVQHEAACSAVALSRRQGARLRLTAVCARREDGERWARLQLAKLGVGSPRHAACAFKED